METGPIKTLVQRQPVVMAAVSAVVLVVALIWISRTVTSGPPEIGQNYFYDLAEGKVFEASAASVVPMDTPSGPGNGVAAIVLSCGSCDDPDQRQIGWLARYSDDALKVLAMAADPDDPLASLGEEQQMMVNAGLLLALPPEEAGSEPQWIPAQSPQGQKLTLDAQSSCPGGARVRFCTP